MEKYLFFNTGANDSICLPASRLTDMGMVSNGTSLLLNFVAAFGGNDGEGEVVLDVTIRSGKEPFIIVVDETTGVKLHADIDSVGAITDFS